MSGAGGSAVLVVGPVLLAGAFGAVVRSLVIERSPRLGLHAVNLTGTVLLVLVMVGASRGSVAPWAALVGGVGFAGAFTTFSGWMALVAERAGAVGWPRAIAVDAVLPVAIAVGLTVAVFAGS